MNWSNGFISKRPDISKKLTQKRQHRKNDLRQAQTDTALSAKNPVMQIWLGKNDLGQTDKQDVRHDVSPEIRELMHMIDGKDQGRLPCEVENG